MNEPTQEQIKEFWGWCGLVHINNPIPAEAANLCEAITIDKPLNGWYCPDYTKGTSKLISFKETPIIDLNNLFKYAVPKVSYIVSFDFAEGGWACYLIGCQGAEPKYIGEAEDPALALFWAIWKVIKED